MVLCVWGAGGLGRRRRWCSVKSRVKWARGFICAFKLSVAQLHLASVRGLRISHNLRGIFAVVLMFLFCCFFLNMTVQLQQYLMFRLSVRPKTWQKVLFWSATASTEWLFDFMPRLDPCYLMLSFWEFVLKEECLSTTKLSLNQNACCWQFLPEFSSNNQRARFKIVHKM